MGRRSVRYAVLLVALFVAACSTRRPDATAVPTSTVVSPSPTLLATLIPTPQAEPTELSASLTPSPLPGETATPAVTPPPVESPVPPAAVPTVFSLGVPGGDVYSLSGLAVDAPRGLAYVYAGRSGPQPDAALPATLTVPAISVVDLASRAVVRLIELPPAGFAGSGQLLVSPDGRRGYAVERGADRLTVFDLQTGHQDGHLDQVHEIALSASGEVLFAAGQSGLAALATADLSQLWRVDDLRYSRVVVNGDRVAAASIAEGDWLAVFDAASGRKLASRALPGFVQGMAAGPEGGWAVHLGTAPPVVQRYDAGLAPLASTETSYGEGLFYDEARERYLLATTGDDPPGRRRLIALDATTLAPVGEADWSWDGPPDVFAGYGDGLIGVRSYEGAALDYVEPETLAPVGRTALGVLLTDLAIDQTGQMLFVADNLDRIHVLHLPAGEERALWEGRAPIALDVAHCRLYVNRPEGVAALDTSSGRVVAQYPQYGMAAPDPARDYVYIVDRGVTIYNRDGQRLGRLDSTFPAENGLSPNPYAFSARVNPYNGYVAVGMNNGVPGSNNASYLRFYPPAADSAQEVPGAFSFLVDVTFAPDDGRVFASYSTGTDPEALQLLDGSGHELARLGGRAGALAFDPQGNLLYVAQDGILARVSAGSLSLQGLFGAPAQVRQVTLNQATSQLYYRDETSSQIRIAALDRLPGLDMRP